jgi:hypothetical protein
MKEKKIRNYTSVLAFFFVFNGMTPVDVHAEGYSFDVYNSTSNAITKILVSEGGKNWGEFNIGRGINPGATVSLMWDENTNNENCKQQIIAVFNDGSKTEPAIFDFCEQDLVLEF